jgi:hypothetical protein
VIEYSEFPHPEYRSGNLPNQASKLAAKLSNPKDQHAVLLMAAAWDKVAVQREAALKKGLEPTPGETP